MKKIATYLALFIVFFGNIVAQNLEGIVLDAETSEPVYNALVYLDGTSFITATNTEGKFKLSVGNRINTRLVISHVSYERIIISEPFDALPEVIYLEKQVIQLDEVTVSAVSQSRYTRNQMLKAFRQQFLGKTKAGKACKILNEDDIRLKYDTVDQILYASSNVPVRIENKRLGYKLLWEIIEFKILYKKDLREDYPIISNTGTVIFEDLAPDNRRIAMNRREAYENSPRQFFKLIAGEKLHEHDYSLYKNDRQYPADKLFIVKDNPSGNTVKTVTVKRDAEDKGEIIVDIRKFSKIGKTFTMKVASQIIFYSDTLSVDISGYEVKPMGSVLITGEMGMYRTGDILPLNYETEKIAEQKSKPDMEEKIYEQIKVFPQEKIHIHTDRSVYVSGEKIWYRIFLLDAISHIPVYGSRYVYVELISPTGELVSRDKIRRDSDSLFHNNIDLTEDLTEGAYLIRAYTNFMRNRPDYFFERKVFIASPEILKTGIENKGTERKKNIPAPQSSYDFDVSFFPEGGYFIPGEVCKTGFKALKTNGLSEDITGIIINDKGDTIVNIRSEHAGMGQFAFLPKHGVKYYAVCSNVPGNEKRFQLPDSNPEACALKVFAHKDNIYITVLKGKNFKEKQLKLVIHTRGFVVYAGELPEQNTLVIEKELILSGVSQVLLLDDKMNPLSERMFFYMDDKELAKTNFSTDKSAYTAGEHISARIQVIDNEENPLDGSFSVAVTDDGDVRADSLFSIVSGLLLCSEIRGYVESPEYYINNPNSADILMLTQAWRRYDIPAILKDSLEKPSYFPETSQQISGHVERVMGKKVNADNTVSLVAPKYTYIDEISTDKDGRFVFNGFEFPDSTMYILQAKSKKGNTYVELHTEPETFPEINTFPVLEYKSDSLFQNHVLKSDMKYIEEYGTRTILLDSVIIQGNRPRPESAYSSLMSTYIYPEDYKHIKGLDLTRALKLVPRLQVFGGEAFVLGQNLKQDTSLFIIDDWILYGAKLRDISDLDINDIETIEFVHPRDLKKEIVVHPKDLKGEIASGVGVTFNAFPVDASGGIIIITTKSKTFLKGRKIQFNIKAIIPKGFREAAEFYSPKYEAAEEGLDRRRTVFWKPNVFFENGEAEFDFYTADSKTTYSVVIEGVTNNGQIIRKTDKIYLELE